MGGSSQPDIPDPQQTAQAQLDLNLKTAQANAQLNRVNQVTPYGTITYNRQASYNDAGYNAAMDKYNRDLAAYNARPQSFAVPAGNQNSALNKAMSKLGLPTASAKGGAPLAPNREDYRLDSMNDTWTQETKLSPEQQRLLDLQQQGAIKTGETALGMLGRINDVYSSPMDTSKLPQVQSQLDYSKIPQLQSQLNLSGLPNIQSSINTSGTPSLQYGVDKSQVGELQRNINTSGLPSIQYAGDKSGVQDIQGQLNTSGLPSIQYAGDKSGLSGIQTAVDPNTTDNELVRQAQDAAYNIQTRYLDPQMQQQENMLHTRLVNQGLQPGTEAYNRAYNLYQTDRNRQYANARDQATIAGNDIAQQIYGRKLSSGTFANQAQQQQYAQMMADLQASNAAQQQQFGQGLQQGQFANQAQQQQYAQSLADLQAANQAQQQQFGQNLQQGQFANTVQQTAYEQALRDLAAKNQTIAQDYSQKMGLAELNNQAQQQGYSQALSSGAFNNQAQQQAYAQQLANANLNNTASNQILEQLMALRQQPLNEFNALRTGANPNLPTLNNSPQVQMGPNVDYGQLVQNQYNSQLSNYNRQSQVQGQAMSMFGNMLGGGSPAGGAGGGGSTGSSIGGMLGMIGGTASGIPGGGAIGAGLGNFIGGLFG